jgi:hypothetical protein
MRSWREDMNHPDLRTGVPDHTEHPGGELKKQEAQGSLSASSASPSHQPVLRNPQQIVPDSIEEVSQRIAEIVRAIAAKLGDGPWDADTTAAMHVVIRSMVSHGASALCIATKLEQADGTDTAALLTNIQELLTQLGDTEAHLRLS